MSVVENNEVHHPTYREYLSEHRLDRCNDVVHENVAAQLLREHQIEPWLYMGSLTYLSGIHVDARSVYNFLRRKGVI